MTVHEQLLTFLLISAALVTGNDVTLGNNDGGKKLFEENFEGSPAIWKQTQNVIINTTEDEVISKIVITDHRPDKDGEVKIVDGGIGVKDINIELSSPSVLRGYNFTVEVYSMAKDKYDQEINSNKPINGGLNDLNIPGSDDLASKKTTNELDNVSDGATQLPATIAKDEEKQRNARDTVKDKTATTLKPSTTPIKVANEKKEESSVENLDSRNLNTTSNDTEKTTEHARFYRDVQLDDVKDNSKTTVKPPQNPIKLAKDNKSLNGALKTEVDKTKIVPDAINGTLDDVSVTPRVEPADDDKSRDKVRDTANVPALLPKENNKAINISDLDARNLNSTSTDTEASTEHTRFVRAAQTPDVAKESAKTTTSALETSSKAPKEEEKVNDDKFESRSLNSTNATTSNTTEQSTEHARSERDVQEPKPVNTPTPTDISPKNEGRKFTPKPVALSPINGDSIVTTKPLILPTEVKSSVPNVPAIYEEHKDDPASLEQLKDPFNPTKVNIPFPEPAENNKTKKDVVSLNEENNNKDQATSFEQLKDSLNTPKLNIPFTAEAKDKKPSDIANGDQKEINNTPLPASVPEKEEPKLDVNKTEVTREARAVEGVEKAAIPVPRNVTELDDTRKEEVETRSTVEETTVVPLKDEEYHPARVNSTSKDIDIAKPIVSLL